jgi:hypothetical protein
MVKAQCAPPHRLILFLQQSSVEWCSSLWTRVVQEVDPHYQRTVMVCSKFDNRQASSQQEGKVDGHGLAGWVQGSQLGRCQPLVFLTQRTTLINAYLPRPYPCRLKEFSERWEVDKYLSASGYLPPNVKPFFVALPKDRSAATSTSADWRRAIQEVDSGVKQHLREGVAGGFDEERFGTRVGFGNLRRQAAGSAGRLILLALGPALTALLYTLCLWGSFLSARITARSCLSAPPLLAAGSWRRSWRVGTATPPPPPWRCCRSGARRWHRSSSLLTGSCRRRGMWCPCAAQVCLLALASAWQRQRMGNAQSAPAAPAPAADSCRAQVAQQSCSTSGPGSCPASPPAPYPLPQPLQPSSTYWVLRARWRASLKGPLSLTPCSGAGPRRRRGRQPPAATWVQAIAAVPLGGSSAPPAV